MLPAGLGAEALAAAMAEPDPDSLAAATRLRSAFGPDVAARAAEQAALRLRARAKFGDAAADLFFTRDGLEQATRPGVADLHAAWFVAAGVTRVLDLGAGIGTDAMAFVRGGLEVVAVERDVRTAEIASANLGSLGTPDRSQVVVADAEQIVEAWLDRVDGVFCDPARRSGAGRLWRVEDFSPSWSLVTRLLDSSRPALIKLGPALPHRLIPGGAEAEWVSDHGDVVEVALRAGGHAEPARRSALITPDDRLVAGPGRADVRPIGAFLYEPDGAVIRSGGIGELAGRLGAGVVDTDIAYLTGDVLVDSVFATTFAVREILPYKEKQVRGWVRDHEIGSLEIMCRGVDLDPAALRRRLRPAGPERTTMIITRTPAGARVIIAERVRSGDAPAQ